MSLFGKILEANQLELQNYSKAKTSLTKEEFLYLKILLAETKKDLPQIKEYLKTNTCGEIQLLLSIKYSLITDSVNESQLKAFESFLSNNLSAFWKAEAYSILAQAYSKTSNLSRAEVYYTKATKAFWDLGVYKKSLKSLISKLLILKQSHRFYDLVEDLENLQEQALLMNQKHVAGVACLELAKIFQKEKAYPAARNLIGKAIKFLENSNTKFYEFALKEKISIDSEVEFMDQSEARFVDYKDLFELIS